MERLKQIFLKIMDIIRQPVMKILPGHLAFFLVLSVIPIVTLVGYIASLFSISIDSMIQFIGTSFPKEVSDLLLPFIDGKGGDASVIIFMISGFVLASNGAHSIIVASDTLYHIKPENYIKRRIKAFFLTVILVLLFIFIVVVLGFGNTILKFILDFGFFKKFTEEIYFIFVLLKWPFAFFLIFFMIKLIYTIAPDFTLKSKYVNVGAGVTTLGWIAVTAIYSYYASNFSNYDLFYGALSNIIILMMWIYILSYTLVIGIAINVNHYELEKNVSHKG